MNIHHISRLANLPLPQDKIPVLEKQLSDTLTYIEQLKTVQTTDIEETSQVTGLENIVREDMVTSSLSQEQVMQNKKDTINGFFQVKAIL